jgi:hypothetical protein
VPNPEGNCSPFGTHGAKYSVTVSKATVYDAQVIAALAVNQDHDATCAIGSGK